MNLTKQLATWWSGTCYHLEQLNAIIGSTDIRTYAWILHDKDISPDTKQPKKAHYHFLVQFLSNQRGSWFKAFASDDLGIPLVQPCRCPQGAYDYLIHDTPTARKQGKYLYNPSERTSTIEQLDAVEMIDESEELYNDLIELLEEQITWHEMIKRKPKRIHMISNIKTAYDILYFERYGAKPNEKC